MNTILTVFKKEIKVTLRDRKTLMSAILIPALAMPLLFLGIAKLTQSLDDKESAKKLKIALIHAPAAIDSLFREPTLTLVQNVSAQAAQDSVRAGRFDAALAFDDGFEAKVDSLGTGAVRFTYKSTNLKVEKRISAKLDQYKASILSRRFRQLNLSESLLKPIDVQQADAASQKEQLGTLAGGFLPYVFILFCFFGCLYPSLDLLTGEKEKGTLETLLTSPVPRFNILLGKMLAIGTVGVCSALMTIGGMYLTLRLLDEIPKEVLTTITDILSMRFVLMLFAMLIPLSLFFAGLLSAIAIRANTFKEAQSYVTPMSFAVILPAAIALMPGIKLTWQTAWIPVLNIALATKEIIAGTIQTGQYVAIVASLIVFALLALAISVRQFSDEKNILK